MPSFRGKQIQTINEVKRVLKILLRSINECEHREKHIQRLGDYFREDDEAKLAERLLKEDMESRNRDEYM